MFFQGMTLLLCTLASPLHTLKSLFVLRHLTCRSRCRSMNHCSEGASVAPDTMDTHRMTGCVQEAGCAVAATCHNMSQLWTGLANGAVGAAKVRTAETAFTIMPRYWCAIL
jgi:hypothetical protein